VSLGGFLPEDVVVLKDPSAERVRQVVGRINVRLREERTRGTPELLLVYYSGRADALSLHLGATSLHWEELRNRTSTCDRLTRPPGERPRATSCCPSSRRCCVRRRAFPEGSSSRSREA